MTNRTFPIEDYTKITKQLADLDDKVQTKHAWGATRAGAQIIRGKIISNAKIRDNPASPNDISKNIYVMSGKRSRAKSRGGPYMRVGVLGGAKAHNLQSKKSRNDSRRKHLIGKTYATGGSSSNPGGDTWYWRFLEFGTNRTKKKSFMLPAVSGNNGDVVARVAKSLSDRIAKEKLKTT